MDSEKLKRNDIIRESLGKVIEVKLKNGEVLRGKLKWFDEHINLLLETVEDKSKGKTSFVLIRGDNIIILRNLIFRGV